ncbi:NadS family protein [Vibrio agarivorans]|uniref:NadS family protein n=1 Tax=Vibrio agarivorans TaxID=153622 RepID=UPI002230CA8F|nr:NadS family protein [Vibrio agarivorans]
MTNKTIDIENLTEENFDFAQLLIQGMEQVVAVEKGEVEPSRVSYIYVADVTVIRKKLGVTRAELGVALNTSAETIKSWELGRRNPTGLANKVLRLIDEIPETYQYLKKL